MRRLRARSAECQRLMLLLPRICQPPRFVDTRSGIWQILKSKPRNGRKSAGAGREDRDMAETKVTFQSSGVQARRHGARAGRREARRAAAGLHRHARLRQQFEFEQRDRALQRCSRSSATSRLRIDMPGCGESEGPRGNLICLEQVQAASDALTFLAKNPNVEGDRIGMIGSSFGAAIAVYVCGVDKRVAGGDLVGRLGRRRAEVPRPASGRGGLEEVHRHAGGGKAPPREDRQVADGAALRHRADPASICAAIWRRTRSRSSPPRPRRACTTSAPTT